MDKQQKKIYARKGLAFPHNQERDRFEGKRTGQEQKLDNGWAHKHAHEVNLEGDLVDVYLVWGHS